jgi:hypothetical protein
VATVLILIFAVVAALALAAWQREKQRGVEALRAVEKVQEAREIHLRQTADEQIRALKAQLTLAERRAPKPAGDVIHAKSWREVRTINESERAKREREEEQKRANTATR